LLKLDKEVSHGIMFIRLEGELNKESFNNFSKEVNNLLYNYGVHYFVFNFKELNIFEKNIFSKFENKLIEIFLSCGKVVMCGLKELQKKSLGEYYNKLFYVNEEFEAFKLLNI